MTTDPLFDKIEAFLSGELSEQEHRTFEAEIASDPNLAATVASHRQAGKAIDYLLGMELKKDIAGWRENLNDWPEAPPPVSNDKQHFLFQYRRWLLMAFLLMVATGAIWYFLKIDQVAQQPLNQQITPPALPPPDTGQTMANSKPGGTQELPEKPEKINPELKPFEPVITNDMIAMADTRLSGFRTAISRQYGQTMGGDDGQDPRFDAGLQALKSRDTTAALQAFLQVEANSGYYSSAQELLAFIYFYQKNYTAAARAYEVFARKNTYPEVDWRLTQFYLADYKNRRLDFWRLTDKIILSTKPHPQKAEVENLISILKTKGINHPKWPPHPKIF